MRILNEQEKRDALNEVLIELSKSQDILKEARDRVSFFMRFEDIYYNYSRNEKFRHYYSDIFSTLTLIDGDSSIGSLDILAQNIQTIKDGYIPKNTDENGDTIDITMKDPFLRSRKLSSGMPHAPLPIFIYGGAPMGCMWV